MAKETLGERQEIDMASERNNSNGSIGCVFILVLALGSYLIVSDEQLYGALMNLTFEDIWNWRYEQIHGQSKK